MSDGRTVEIGAVGREGMLGWNAALGMKHALLDAMVQVPGEALRVDTAVFQKAVQESPALRDLTQRFAEHALADIAQTAACNRLHSLEERCCRWLLIAHDSARSDKFSLTHEFLAMMLGVQRTAVSIAASLLRRAGFIEYSRGTVTVTDRRGLEGMSCECYKSIQERLIHLYARRD
jgi:CRP-like cAMP-binding protein